MSPCKTIVIHQPDFMPYLGFFQRLFYADVFVVLDHVQLLKRGWHHRDKIKGPQGAVWLSVPIKGIAKKQKICEAKIDYSQNWIEKHLRVITSYYQNAAFFNDIYRFIEGIYQMRYEVLSEINTALIKFFLDYFAINVELCFSSEMNIATSKNQMNIDIVKKTGGNIYLSGLGAKDYLDESLFEREGIAVKWQEYTPPVYPQLHGEFIPDLSCLDFAMNCGDDIGKYSK